MIRIAHRRARAAAEEVGRLHAERITAAIAEAQAEIARADDKVSSLLPVATWMFGGLAALVTYAHGRVTALAAIALLTAALLSGAALVTLLLAMRPRLHGARRGKPLPSHQRLLDARPADLHPDRKAELRMFSILAAAKHRKVRRALDLLLTAAPVVVAAAILITVTR